ncbi:MAG: hypothetical protein IT423_11170 [Pirellulaceae bacterium]|nr:hypothetical protein [Pirellulaceae bacterium]
MKIKNLNPIDNYLAGSWEALGNGAPVLVALAQICSHAWTRGAHLDETSGNAIGGNVTSGNAAEPDHAIDAENSSPLEGLTLEGLSGEAQAILLAARTRGIIELKAVNTAFDAAARLLAVYVEETDERTIAFRDARKPEVTVRFLDGFRELCQRGLIIHHIYRDFSLSPRGFELAKQVQRDKVQRWLDMATEFGIHD